MPAVPEIAVVVSTFQRPGHLRRCLASLAAQRGVEGRFEVVVVDDGSRDETADVVAAFGRTAPCRVEFTTHAHEGFQQARCRNEGILASRAPYLLFVDGDCVLPSDHLRQHLAARRAGVARCGDCFRIDEAASQQIDEAAIASGRFADELAPAVRRWRGRLYRKALFYQLVGHRLRPKLIGWNMAIWRCDLERVNGFDQRFRGWGCEDDDLAQRLRAAGVRLRTALGYTHGFHLWHPLHTTTPQSWRDGGNVPYLRRPVRLTRCLDGLRSRPLEELSAEVRGGPQQATLVRQLAAQFRGHAGPVEVELLLWPASRGFSREAEQRILLAAPDERVPAAVKRQAVATVLLHGNATAAELLTQVRQLLTGGRPATAELPQRIAA